MTGRLQTCQRRNRPRENSFRFENDPRQTGENNETGDVMSSLLATGDRIIDPMIALSGCSTRQRILVAGSKSMELMMDLQRRGYLLAAAAGNCGRPYAHFTR
jgi:predicted LPLAT superfamily acyltransferase